MLHLQMRVYLCEFKSDQLELVRLLGSTWLHFEIVTWPADLRVPTRHPHQSGASEMSYLPFDWPLSPPRQLSRPTLREKKLGIMV